MTYRRKLTVIRLKNLMKGKQKARPDDAASSSCASHEEIKVQQLTSTETTSTATITTTMTQMTSKATPSTSDSDEMSAKSIEKCNKPSKIFVVQGSAALGTSTDPQPEPSGIGSFTFDAMMEESTSTAVLESKESLPSGAVKVEAEIKEESIFSTSFNEDDYVGEEVHIEKPCMKEEPIEEMILGNENKQLLYNQVTSAKENKDTVIVSPKARIVLVKNYVTKSSLKQRPLTYFDVKQFKCSCCDYECDQMLQLKRHMSIHPNNMGFRCSVCDYVCRYKCTLMKHMLTHSDIKLFRCSECGNEFKWKSCLMQHMLTHSTIKLFKCSDCDYECNKRVSLRRHMLTHSKIEQFRCSECGYECKYKSKLMQHMLNHSNIKLFRCSKCDYVCKYKSTLMEHIVTHSNIKRFKCPDCDYECNQKGGLKRHMLNHSGAGEHEILRGVSSTLSFPL